MIDGFTGDQRFYLGWAQVWRRSYREANLRQRLLTDPHSPSEQRTAVVRNLDPWYDAYKPAPASKLYLAPSRASGSGSSIRARLTRPAPRGGRRR